MIVNSLILFFFGICIGSFLNVVILRYDPDKTALVGKHLGGRSKCRSCGKTLRWFELIPIFSFFVQKGRCRTCHRKISWQYPIVEILSGIILVAAYLKWGLTLKALLIALFALSLLVLSFIDFYFQVIPDELNLFIGLLGVLYVLLGWQTKAFGLTEGSFIGYYASVLGLRQNIFLNHLAAALFGGLLFMGLIFLTRGRGMGMGDMKLGAAAGLFIGWPDIVLALMLSFILGGFFGGISLFLRRKKMKDMLPFGPFMAAGILLIVFLGFNICNGYFRFFNLA
ncbi:MAG TPA: prepilin peptidase [Candidatus Colwellbacteria bacterium]|nr:prepilin peptidase [Candidatus Colwellbacteria bacterium]HQA95840.1 prepilin peptidase [Candidatus Colwellbacteria bacterium]